MFDLEFFTHSFHQVTVEIGGIVSDDSLLIGCGFNPFCEVVYGHQNEPMSMGSSGFNWSDDIHTPSGERPRRTRCIEFVGRYSYHISMYLALVTLLNILDAVYFHSHLEILCS